MAKPALPKTEPKSVTDFLHGSSEEDMKPPPRVTDLWYDPHGLPQTLQAYVANVLTCHVDAALLGLVEAKEHPHDGALSRIDGAGKDIKGPQVREMHKRNNKQKNTLNT